MGDWIEKHLDVLVGIFGVGAAGAILRLFRLADRVESLEGQLEDHLDTGPQMKDLTILETRVDKLDEREAEHFQLIERRLDAQDFILKSIHDNTTRLATKLLKD